MMLEVATFEGTLVLEYNNTTKLNRSTRLQLLKLVKHTA